MEKIFTSIESKRVEYEALLEELVTLESYTPDKPGVDVVGDRIRSFAEGKGFHVKTVPFEKAGNGLLITWNEEAQLPPVAFTGHLDTVHPVGTFEKPVFRKWTVLRSRCLRYEGRSCGWTFGNGRAEGKRIPGAPAEIYPDRR